MIIFNTIDYTGTPTEHDIRAALHYIGIENARRADLETTLPALPSATGSEIKSSYLASLLFLVNSTHESYIDSANEVDYASLREAYESATDTERASIKSILGL